MGPIGVLRSLAGTLMTRAGLANISGLSFGGKRDLYEALGYQRTLLPRDYRSRYERSGIAKRIVEALPAACWRGEMELIEDEDPDVSTDFEAAFDDLNDRLHVWNTLRRVDVLAGLGRYACLLIGAPDALDKELPRSFDADEILYLTPYGEEDATVDTWVDDALDPRYGQALTYSFTRIGATDRRARIVHWSRVVHVVDGQLDDPIFGTPRLQAVWNYLDDLEKVVGGGSEAFWLRVNQGLHFDLDPSLELDSGEAQKVKDAAEELAHGIRRTMATRGMKMDVLGSDVSNFNSQVEALMTLIAGTTGIPKRILIGSERGELSSTQDRTEWGERVSERRESFVGPSIIRPFVDLLIEHGVLPEPESYVIRWPEMAKLDDMQRAEIAGKWAGLNGAMQETVVTGAEIRDRVLGLEALEPLENDPFAVQAEPAPLPEAPLPDDADADADADADQAPEVAARSARGKALFEASQSEVAEALETWRMLTDEGSKS
jgi:hypothetical protein